jgi:hypothetical protein
MFNTSRDILNLTLAISIASIAFFISWGLYYLVMMAKRIRHLTREAGEIISNIKETTGMIREKVEASAATIALIAEGIKKILAVVGEKKERKRKERT